MFRPRMNGLSERFRSAPPAIGSDAAYRTVLTPLMAIAPKHWTHGSVVVYSVRSFRTFESAVLICSRTLISAWASRLMQIWPGGASRSCTRFLPRLTIAPSGSVSAAPIGIEPLQ